ncbi:uncharacterized protein METZ01_LOCUS470042 [marine metagenome]|uniref:Uncharacterized protein n=1 Tax=marine metagenome TaxID=408172 RepID=A0A383BCM2_9ZZZZ
MTKFSAPDFILLNSNLDQRNPRSISHSPISIPKFPKKL